MLKKKQVSISLQAIPVPISRFDFTIQWEDCMVLCLYANVPQLWLTSIQSLLAGFILTKVSCILEHAEDKRQQF